MRNAPMNSGNETISDQEATLSLLRLRARDVEDMDIIAACLQDALVPLREVSWLPQEKRLALILNRFMWERRPRDRAAGPEATGPEDGAADDASLEEGEVQPLHWRSHTALVFDRVRRVQSCGFDRRDRNQLLNLLTLASRPDSITFVFSGAARLRLEVARICCHLCDVGEPWPSWALPQHEAAVPPGTLAPENAP